MCDQLIGRVNVGGWYCFRLVILAVCRSEDLIILCYDFVVERITCGTCKYRLRWVPVTNIIFTAHALESVDVANVVLAVF
jgi:hypothetical protein